ACQMARRQLERVEDARHAVVDGTHQLVGVRGQDRTELVRLAVLRPPLPQPGQAEEPVAPGGLQPPGCLGHAGREKGTWSLTAPPRTVNLPLSPCKTPNLRNREALAEDRLEAACSPLPEGGSDHGPLGRACCGRGHAPRVAEKGPEPAFRPQPRRPRPR